jgi:C4-dicarboxylate-binding protein DctP
MKKLFSILLASLMVFSLSLAGCSSSGSTASNSSQANSAAASSKGTDGTVYVFKYGHSMSESSARHQSMLFFKQEIEKRANGRIKVEIYPNGTLGSEAEMMDMVKMNTLQGTAGSQFEKANSEYLIYGMPFMFNTTDELQTVLNSDFEKKLEEGALKNGYYIPVTGIGGGFRQITNNKRPINTPDDLKGLKIRTPALTPIVKTMETLGANPTQMNLNDVYMGLKTNVVDGQENPASTVVDQKFYEVQKYMSIINYMIYPECFFTSDKWYESLPDDLKQTFNEVAKETMQKRTETWLASENKCIDDIKKSCKVNTISSDNIETFREKCQPVWQEFVQSGSYTQEDLDTLQNDLKKIRS